MTRNSHSYLDAARSVELPPGYILANDYYIEQTLGKGGFGITYLASDLILNRKVVIKENFPASIVHRGVDSISVYASGQDQDSIATAEWARDSFLKEAQTLAILDHPNIVKILRAFAANGTAYFIMPFIEGYVLKAHIHQLSSKDAPQLAEKVKEYLNKILSALAYLHNKGILHRDIKPDNILITKEGEPLLIDFGAARFIDSQKTMTQIGSPGYMPFEQVQTRGNVGPWSDIYALGATFYYILTGRKPESSLDRITGDTQERLCNNSYFLQFYDNYFLSSIDKAMSPSVEGRYQNAKEWYDAINQQYLNRTNEHAYYFLSKSHHQKGPYTLEELSCQRDEGLINGDTLIWTEGMAEWSPLANVFSPILPDAAEDDVADGEGCIGIIGSVVWIIIIVGSIVRMIVEWVS